MSSAARASSTSPEGASCSCSASRTPSPSQRVQETPDPRARHVREALADLRAELEALFAEDVARSSPRTLPPLPRFLHSCASMTSAPATSSRTSPTGTASTGPVRNSGSRVVVVPLLPRRRGCRRQQQPPRPRTGGAALRACGRESGEERDYGGKGAPIPPSLFPDVAAAAAGG
jgi:hypothetical protein